MEDQEMLEAKRELVAMAEAAARAEAEAAAATLAASGGGGDGAGSSSHAAGGAMSSSSDESDGDDEPVLPLVSASYRRKSAVKGSEQWEAPWLEQRECALLLLKARMLLRKMIETRLYEERLNRGALSALEVHNLIRCQQEGDDTDFVTEITELKRNLMTEIRRNHTLEKQVVELDKLVIEEREREKLSFPPFQRKHHSNTHSLSHYRRIGLLIHNVGHLATHAPASKPKKDKDKEKQQENALTAAKLQLYSHLFYLLQTEPKYLARLVGCMADAEGVDALLDTILLTMYGDAFSPREEFLILTLFKIAITQEMKNVTSVSDFVKEQSILAKMVLTYNRRK
jgi:hypothetical protein